MKTAGPYYSVGRAAGATAIFIGFQVGGMITLLGAGEIMGMWSNTDAVRWSLGSTLLMINTAAAACVLEYEYRRQQLPWHFWPPARISAAWALLPLLAITIGNLAGLDLIHRLMVSAFPTLGVLKGVALDLYDIAGHPITVPLVLIVIAPITEELFFRGLILTGLLKTQRPGRAIVISASLFAAMHLNLSQLIPTFLIGVVLGWFYYRTQSLFLCIVGHAVHNAVVLYFTARTVSLGFHHTAVMSDPTVWPSWWFFGGGMVLMAGGVALIMRLTKPPFSPVPPPLPKAG